MVSQFDHFLHPFSVSWFEFWNHPSIFLLHHYLQKSDMLIPGKTHAVLNLWKFCSLSLTPGKNWILCPTSSFLCHKNSNMNKVSTARQEWFCPNQLHSDQGTLLPAVVRSVTAMAHSYKAFNRVLHVSIISTVFPLYQPRKPGSIYSLHGFFPYPTKNW